MGRTTTASISIPKGMLYRYRALSVLYSCIVARPRGSSTNSSIEKYMFDMHVCTARAVCVCVCVCVCIRIPCAKYSRPPTRL